MPSSGWSKSTRRDREADLIAGPCPGNDVQPLERNLPPVVAETELLRRPVESFQRGIDFIELARRTGGVRFIELLVHGVGADVGRMKWHQRQISCLFLLRSARPIGDDHIQ